MRSTTNTWYATNPPVFMCKQCIAVQVEEKEGVCRSCESLLQARIEQRDAIDRTLFILRLTVAILAGLGIVMVGIYAAT